MHNDLTKRLENVSSNKVTGGDSFDIYAELDSVLSDVGLSGSDAGGAISFYGADPIVKSTIRLASGAAIGLMGKAVVAAHIWRLRGGKGQDLHVDLARALERMCIANKYLERVNGYHADVPDRNLFALIGLYKTRDGRHVIPANIYPKLRDKMQNLLECNNSPQSVARAIAGWDARELEEAAAKQGLVMGMSRTLEEFMTEPVFTEYLAGAPLIEIEKIADSDPIPFSNAPVAPLDGIRALGMGHVIAGAGLGRALATHGADVLNVWRPHEFEHDSTYYSANVGMRSARIDYKSESGNALLKDLLASADVFFANRRPALMEELGLTPAQAAALRPGIVYCNISAHGDTGPWADRPGFDQIAGVVAGMMAFEGTPDAPKIPVVGVVNDYLVSWLTAIGVMSALARRATEGGSYRVHVSLTRAALWLMSLGVFDAEYAEATAGTAGGHEDMLPEMFVSQTPVGAYRGYTDQVHMSQTPEYYRTVMVPRGSSEPRWLAV